MKTKYYTFSVMEDGENKFLAFSTEGKKVKRIIKTDNYGEMVDAVIENSVLDVDFTCIYGDNADADGRNDVLNDLMKGIVPKE